jgi:FkbM family methyltransferase
MILSFDIGRFIVLRLGCGWQTALKVGLCERLGSGNYTVYPRGISQPIRLRQGTSDHSVLTDILGHRELYMDLPFMPESIIDAGSYTGISTAFYANTFPQAKILAIEADAKNFALCCENTRGYSNVTCVNAALWHHPAKVALVNPGESLWALKFQETDKSDPETVTALTVSQAIDLTGRARIDILKMDIEGAEREILLHEDGWINRVRVLILELHERFNPGCEAALDQVLARIKAVRSLLGEKTVIQRCD